MNKVPLPSKLFIAAHAAIVVPALGWAARSAANAGIIAGLAALLAVWGAILGAAAERFLPRKLGLIVIPVLLGVADGYALIYGLTALSGVLGALGTGLLLAASWYLVFVPALAAIWTAGFLALLTARRPALNLPA